MAVQIRQALKDTTDLISICYDLRSGMRYTIVDEINLEQVFELLIKLRGIEEQLFEKSMPNADIQLSSNVVNGPLLRCSDEVGKVGSMLRQRTPSESSDQKDILNSLAESITALKKVVEGNNWCVCTFTKKSNADTVQRTSTVTSDGRSVTSVISNCKCRIIHYLSYNSKIPKPNCSFRCH